MEKVGVTVPGRQRPAGSPLPLPSASTLGRAGADILLRVVVFDPSEDGAADLVAALRCGHLEADWVRVETPADLELALNRRPCDLVLADHTPPTFNGMFAVRVTRHRGIPCILVPPAPAEEWRAAAAVAGAWDCISRVDLAELAPSVRRALRLDPSVPANGSQQAQEAFYRMLVDNVSDVLAVMDPRGVLCYVSPSWQRVLGHVPAEMVGHSLFDYVHEAEAEELAGFLFRELPPAGQAGRPLELEFRCRHQDGSWHVLEASGKRLERPAGALLLSARDLTGRESAQQTSRHLAYFDGLTGMPNRTLFRDRLSQAIAYGSRSGQGLAVVFLDVDGFKNVNDSLGHTVGDELLCALAQRLQAAVREGDTLARWGGDEFTLLLPNLVNAEAVGRVVQKVLQQLKPSFRCQGHDLRVTASAGVSVYPADGQDPQTLLKNADTALYRAKEQGRDSYRMYAPSMHARVFERLLLENGLADALEREEFVLHYQPLVDLASGAVVTAEALVRWRHPELGLVAPTRFIPVAEDTGLIVPLGEWVLRTACAQARAWGQQTGRAPRVAVNVSVRQLRQRDFVERLETILRETDLPAAGLELELTEGKLMEHAETTVATLARLRELGVRVAIDDFGMGYSSLSHLRRLPIDTLKIDASFVEGLPADLEDAAVVNLIIDMAHGLKLRVVAEGVETERQRSFLRAHHCDQAQGFLLGRAVPADELTALLAVGPAKGAASTGAAWSSVDGMPSRLRSLRRWRRGMSFHGVTATAFVASLGALVALSIDRGGMDRPLATSAKAPPVGDLTARGPLPSGELASARGQRAAVLRERTTTSTPPAAGLRASALPSALPPVAADLIPRIEAAAPPTRDDSSQRAAAPATATPDPVGAVPARSFVTAIATLVHDRPGVRESASLDLEVGSARLQPGPYVVQIQMVNEGERAIEVATIDAVETVNGERRTLAVRGGAARVRPRERSLVGTVRGTWGGEAASWALEVFLSSRDGTVLKSQVVWK